MGHKRIHRGTATASGSGDMGPGIQGCKEVANLRLKLHESGQPVGAQYKTKHKILLAKLLVYKA